MESVKLPSTLKEIHYNAFFKCANLKQVDFPQAVEIIGEQCFYQSGLTKVVVPHNVTRIQRYTFSGCQNLREVTFANDSKTQKIDEYAFKNSGVTKFSAPKALKEVGPEAFSECKLLQRVELNDNLDTLGNKCFAHSGAQSVSFPPHMLTLDPGIFEGCLNIRVLAIPEG